MQRTVMPSFRQFPDEARIIGVLLAGYTDLEVGLLHCLQIVRDDFDVVLKTMFRVRGESMRINVADGLGHFPYSKLDLGEAFERSIDALRHCVRIRNQYAHCVWWDDNSGKIAFANLEEVAKLNEPQKDLEHLTRYHVDVPLLEAQEAYFVYTSDILVWLNFEGRRRAGTKSTLFQTEPSRMEKPQLRIQ